MFLKYEHYEAMLTKELNFRYFLHQILWKRQLLFGVIFLVFFNLAYSFFKGQHLIFYQYSYIIFSPIISMLSAAILMLFTEKYFFRDLSHVTKNKIFSNIKYINQISSTLYVMATVSGICISEGKVEDFTLEKFLLKLGIAFIVVFPAAWFFNIFGGYKTIRSEMERHGLLDKFNS